MRDKYRIDGFITTLENYWYTYCPDWRFGQLICNLQSFVGNDLFYYEEEDLLKILDKFFKGEN